MAKLLKYHKWTLYPPRPGDKEIRILSHPPGCGDYERLECMVSRDDCDSGLALRYAKIIAAAPDLLSACEAALVTADYEGKRKFIRSKLIRAIKKAGAA